MRLGKVMPGSLPANRASRRMLRSEPPDAVVAYNDLIALGLMSQAQTLGMDVPGDVSIAGFDNIVYSRYAGPGLTTVDLAGEAMGATAMQRLIERIRGESSAGGHETLVTQVIARGSTRRRGERG